MPLFRTKHPVPILSFVKLGEQMFSQTTQLLKPKALYPVHHQVRQLHILIAPGKAGFFCLGCDAPLSVFFAADDSQFSRAM
jgi:hypothetical protein